MSWPPDRCWQVTRTTSARTAYDPNTPTLFPQTRYAIEAQQAVYDPGKLLTPVDPSRNSEAAVSPRCPRLAPREAQHGARDEFAPTIFYRNGSTERGSSNDKVKSRVPSVTANVGKLFAGKLNPSLQTNFSSKPTGITTTISKKSFSSPKIFPASGFGVEITNRMTEEQSDGGSSSTKNWWAARRGPSVTEKVTKKITVLKSNVRRRRRPSEIFSAHFSFDASTLRTAGPTPQISPRTSISGCQSSQPAPLIASRSSQLSCGVLESPVRSSSRAKRQRRHSPKSSKMARYQCSQIQREHQSNNSVLSTRQEQFIWPFKANQASCLSTDVHPGRQVDFTRPRTPQLNDSCNNYSPSYVQPRGWEGQRRYSAPGELLGTRRDASAPSRWAWFKHFRAQRTITNRVLLHTDRAKQLDTAELFKIELPALSVGTAISWTPTQMIATAAGTPEAVSSPRLSKEALCALSTSNTCCRPARSVSDPSMERFLAHVRASQEMRARMKEAARNNAVFVDESDKGFLSGEPL